VAPAASFGTESSLLSAVANCYGPEKGVLYQIYQDQAFTYVLPPGWTVAPGEGQNNINLTDGQGDVVAYQATISGDIPFNTPQDLINGFLNVAKITSVSPLWTTDTPAQQINGATDSGEYEEYTATYNGTAVQGLVFAATQILSPGANYNTGQLRILQAPVANWNGLFGAMLQMAGSIDQNPHQDLQTISQLSQQWQNFSGQVGNFDDTLNNQQLVQNPVTGKYFEAPYASWDSGGDPPGYYQGDQLLTQIQRP
jgi:hypothetical protein